MVAGMRMMMMKMMAMINLVIMFCILQWNARSLIANGQELKKFIRDSDMKPHIVCVQETWLKPCLDFVIPGYVSLRKDRSDNTQGGGCATFVKCGIQYKLKEGRIEKRVFNCGSVEF